MNESLSIEGRFEVVLKRDGKVIESRLVKNIITNAGKSEIANLAGNVSSPVAFTYLALGIGTAAADATDTVLGSEITNTGLGRSAATVSRVTTTVTNDTLQLVKEWTATGAKAVTEVGAFNNASTGTMLGRQVFSAINTANGDTIEVTYKFIFA